MSTVSPSIWCSFYEAFKDILEHWRVILEYLRSDNVKGKKIDKMKAIISLPQALQELLIKMTFLRTNYPAVISRNLNQKVQWCTKFSQY